jgi:hypothetical protein
MPKVDLDKKIELLKLFNRDAASTKEVAGIVANLIKVVRDVKAQLQAEIQAEKKELGEIAERTSQEAVREAITTLKRAERELVGRVNNLLKEIKETSQLELAGLTREIYQ